MAPVISSQPEPATNPPITGMGTKRTRFPARSRPTPPSRIPVPIVATKMAQHAVRNTRSGGAVTIAAVMLAAIKPKMGAVRSCGMAIDQGSELPIATAMPITTALSSAMPNPYVDQGSSGPSKMRAEKEKEKRIVNSPVMAPAQTEAATRDLRSEGAMADSLRPEALTPGVPSMDLLLVSTTRDYR